MSVSTECFRYCPIYKLSSCKLLRLFHDLNVWSVFFGKTPHAVQWMRPEAQEGCEVSDWFNILVLHQNRWSLIFNESCAYICFRK